ncbi:hypothetical protein B0T24DRAFT_599676 [Lasiosphaeria ovina]|uniref:F-box domain-containing protein n=1 Tax=Lasiosphaeria ovina TaxID=92902 RepID=A0AAE0MZG4_9PEZI|nr:hypothetical protein B0T24DRAFT_599676 [Lasiosphaeria ovina]
MTYRQHTALRANHRGPATGANAIPIVGRVRRALPAATGTNPVISGNNTAAAPSVALIKTGGSYRCPSLPNEVLLGIFKLAQDDTSAGQQPNKTIQSLRLVSRRFCHLSTHLLLPVVDVAIELDSFERLNNISWNPAISRGVHTVRLTAFLLEHGDTALSGHTRYGGLYDKWFDEFQLNISAKRTLGALYSTLPVEIKKAGGSLTSLYIDYGFDGYTIDSDPRWSRLIMPAVKQLKSLRVTFPRPR